MKSFKTELKDKFCVKEKAEALVSFKIAAHREHIAPDLAEVCNIAARLSVVFNNRISGKKDDYTVTILLDNEPIIDVSEREFVKYRNCLWKLLEENTEVIFDVLEIDTFFNGLNVKSLEPLVSTIEEVKRGIKDLIIDFTDVSSARRTVILSCKSDMQVFSQFNIGGKTEFIFEVAGSMDDEKMEYFNTILNETGSVRDKMLYLRNIGCDMLFIRSGSQLAKANLTKCGGKEMLAIIGRMLKYFYFDNLSVVTTMEDCIQYLVYNDVAEYNFDGLEDIYRSKIAEFLQWTFNGMRLDSPYDSRSYVRSGMIVVEYNCKEVAFNSIMNEELKDFLVAKTTMDKLAISGNDLLIYKVDNRYYLNLSFDLALNLHRDYMRDALVFLR